VGSQRDPARDLQRQEDRDGEDAEADTDLPGRWGAAGGVQPPPQDRQHEQAQQQLAADPDHGRQDVDEPHERPDADDARLLFFRTGSTR
jgi:hypothetical protein